MHFPLVSILLVLPVAFAAATLAGVTGFGGAAVLLPVLVVVFGVRDAVPILTVAQLIGNGSRVWFNRRELDWRVVGCFALGGIPLALIGSRWFAVAPVGLLTRVLGLFLIAIVIWRRWAPKSNARFPLWGFVPVGAGASFLSALLGSVGPLMAPLFLAFGLVKGAYIGTEALATVVMHLAKLGGYRIGGVLPGSSVALGLALGPAMVAGSWVGKKLVDRLSPKTFVTIIEVVMTVAGVLFLIKG